MMQFASFDVDIFLRDYWQRRPLLIRNPWASWSNPLAPDELAGLACEEGVEARLVMQAKGTWAVEHGPFAEARFGKLGDKHWTLLVQAVDHHVPDVAALIEPFRFIPDWRIDDVMVSYASDGGGVGPHYDQYDVFLVQGLGRRRWQLGGRCDGKSALLPHDDLRLLADFKVSDEWILEPGDILYIPPGIAHDGVAVGDDCMTYSIGFRAPSRGELIADWADDLVQDLADEDRYVDAGLIRQNNPGEIGADAITALHAMVTQKLADRDAFARWFGAYNSLRKYPEIDFSPEQPVSFEEVRTRIAGAEGLVRNPASRFSFIRKEAGVLLFVDGECFECSGEAAEFAEALCGAHPLRMDPAQPYGKDVCGIVARLANHGSIAFEDEN